MRLRRTPLGAKRTFLRVSVFQRGWSGLAVDCDSVLGNRSVEKLYVWNLYSFLRSFPGTHFAFQTCEKLTRLFKVQRLSRGPLRLRKRSSSMTYDGGATWPLSRQVLGEPTSCGDERPVIGFSNRTGFAQAGAVRCEDCPPGEVPVLPSHLVS